MQGYPRVTADGWSGVETVDACLTFNSAYTSSMQDSGEITYLFVGSKYFKFSNMMMVEEAGNVERDWGLPSNLDAAFQWSKTGLMYFIKGKKSLRICY